MSLWHVPRLSSPQKRFPPVSLLIEVVIYFSYCWSGPQDPLSTGPLGFRPPPEIPHYLIRQPGSLACPLWPAPLRFRGCPCDRFWAAHDGHLAPSHTATFQGRSAKSIISWLLLRQRGGRTSRLCGRVERASPVCQPSNVTCMSPGCEDRTPGSRKESETPGAASLAAGPPGA